MGLLVCCCFPSLLLQLPQGFNRVMSMVEHVKDDVELRSLRQEIADLKKALHDSTVRVDSLEKDKEKDERM